MHEYQSHKAKMTKKISPTEWERHKEPILRMRRLGVKVNGPDGIIDRMKHNYGFTTSHSQMELQLSKWQERKKLSKMEWCRVLHIVNKYNEAGKNCPIRMNGHLIPKRTLDRKRRLYRKTSEYHNACSVSEGFLPDCVTIQTEEPLLMENTNNDEGQAYLAPMTDAPPEMTFMSEGSVLAPLLDILDGTEEQSSVDSAGLISGQLSTNKPASLSEHISPQTGAAEYDQVDMVEAQTIESGEPPVGVDDVLLTDNAMLSRPYASSSLHALTASEQQIPGLYSTLNPIRQLMGNLRDDFVPMKGIHFPYGISLPQDCCEWLLPQGSETIGFPEELPLELDILTPQTQSPVSESSLFTGYDATASCQAFADSSVVKASLAALLPPNNAPITALLRRRNLALNQAFKSPVYRILISCIENNFAGLENVPTGEVLKLLKQDVRMRSRLVQYLQQTPRALGTALVEKLLVAAIEEEDAITVSELVGTRLVKINDVVCTSGGCKYTAIQRSVMLWRPDVFWALVEMGADTTYSGDSDVSILQLALKAMKQHENTDITLIQTLLDQGALADADSLLIALELNDTDLLNLILLEFDPVDEDLVDRKDLRRTASMLRAEDMRIILLRVLETFEKGSALEIIRQLLLKNGSWRRRTMDCIDRAATFAAESGHFDVLQLLLPLTATRAGPLAAAVRLRQHALVKNLLVSGMQQAFIPCRLKDDFIPTTPLAEAILSKDPTLLELFEKHPRWKRVWSTTQSSLGLEATLYAACKEGNLAYCQKILDVSLNETVIDLPYSSCIHEAVRNGHETIAMYLIDAGVQPSFKYEPRDDNTLGHRANYERHCLFQALRQRRRALFERILDSDFEWHDDLGVCCTIYALQNQLFWAIDQLLKVRPHQDQDFLEGVFKEAVLLGLKAEFDQIVVSHGLPIETNELTRTAPALEEAIKKGDVEVIRSFLGSGSGPRLALIMALEALVDLIDEAIKDEGTLPPISISTIINSFKETYPNGIRGFGGSCLAYAIESDNIALLDVMLEAKLDVNDRDGDYNALGTAIHHQSASQLDIVRRILQAGGDLDGCARYPYGKPIGARTTALLEAIYLKNKALVEFLIDFGADIHQKARLGVKRTPLQAACEAGSTEIVDLLLSLGARADEAPAFRDGATSLQLCARNGHVGTAIKLLNTGADVHARPSFTEVLPPLREAAENGRLDMISLLWQAAGDRKFSLDECELAMSSARYNGHIACRDLIKELLERDHGSMP